jgi:hypothetical protein
VQSVTKTLTIDGQPVTFQRLSLEDMPAISDQIKTEREKLARELGREEKLDKYEITNLVLELRSKPPTVAEILASTDTAQGASRVIRMSLNKSGVPADKHGEIIAKIEIPAALELARNLVLDVQDEPEDAKAAERARRIAALKGNAQARLAGIQDSIKYNNSAQQISAYTFFGDRNNQRFDDLKKAEKIMQGAGAAFDQEQEASDVTKGARGVTGDDAKAQRMVDLLQVIADRLGVQ